MIDHDISPLSFVYLALKAKGNCKEDATGRNVLFGSPEVLDVLTKTGIVFESYESMLEFINREDNK